MDWGLDWVHEAMTYVILYAVIANGVWILGLPGDDVSRHGVQRIVIAFVQTWDAQLQYISFLVDDNKVATQ
jgi:hypothetical protein